MYNTCATDGILFIVYMYFIHAICTFTCTYTCLYDSLFIFLLHVVHLVFSMENDSHIYSDFFCVYKIFVN